jgi:tRNA (pseudouridine54-N1)-methyltransferase
MDLLARSITAALLRSHGIREDSAIHLVLDDAMTIAFDGSSLRGLHPDERSTAAQVRTALEQRDEAVGRQPVTISPGISVRRIGLAATINSLEGTIYQLHEDGSPIRDEVPPDNAIFVLSDHRAFTEADEETLRTAGAKRVSLGPESLHADQAITVANNWLDTDGFREYVSR